MLKSEFVEKLKYRTKNRL